MSYLCANHSHVAIQPGSRPSNRCKPSTEFSLTLVLLNRQVHLAVKQHLLEGMQGQPATLQVSYAIWQQSLLQASQQLPSPHAASAAVVWGGFVASKMLRHPHPGQTMTRWFTALEATWVSVLISKQPYTTSTYGLQLWLQPLNACIWQQH